MNLLQYTSNEMYSSTQLIRNSKMIFEKIIDNEIDKAIILRDGKPSFMLLDFEKYEKIMNEYIELKNKDKKHKLKTIKTNKNIPKDKESVEEIKVEKDVDKKEELNKLSTGNKKEIIKSNINLNKDSDEHLKEFWD